MRLIPPLLVALSLSACAGDPSRDPEAKAFGLTLGPAPVVVAPDPVVHFRIRTIRSWSDVYFIVSEEDRDMTLREALAFGLPAELWIRCRFGDPAYRYAIFWVAPLRA